MRKRKRYYNYRVVRGLLYVLCKVNCVKVLKPNGRRMWELTYRQFKTYNEGIIIEQIGGKI